jgi:hypothetical protein
VGGWWHTGILSNGYLIFFQFFTNRSQLVENTMQVYQMAGTRVESKSGRSPFINGLSTCGRSPSDTFYALGNASYINCKTRIYVQYVVTSIMNAFAFEIG